MRRSVRRISMEACASQLPSANPFVEAKLIAVHRAVSSATSLELDWTKRTRAAALLPMENTTGGRDDVNRNGRKEAAEESRNTRRILGAGAERKRQLSRESLP